MSNPVRARLDEAPAGKCRRLRRAALAAAVAVCVTSAVRKSAASPGHTLNTDQRGAQHPHGHPKVKLDRLEFPADVPDAAHFKHQLVRFLKHEVWRADWGAGRGSTIEYRFFVKELTLQQQSGVLRVTCTALGELPHGRAAKSRLSFGGSPKKKNAIVARVLRIVSRGVITRLAEMERVRRNRLRRRRLKAAIVAGN